MQNIKITTPKNQLFDNALKIVKTLVNHNFIAYYAGGCVRDLVMRKNPNDIDIVTSAKPDDILKLFKNTVEVGKSFGVIIVILNKIKYDIATFRRDNKYIDGRRPLSIEFSDAKEDVIRRDFTVNGLLFDPIKNEIIDYVNGIEDIYNKIIRSIGNPYDRFNDDHLRILRCIRFSHKLGFKIEENTYNALKELSYKLKLISVERINEELSKILCLPDPHIAIKLLNQTNILENLFPEFVELKDINKFNLILKMLENIKIKSYELILAILFLQFEDKSYEIAKKICSKLKISNNQTKLILELIIYHKKFNDVKKMSLSELKKFLRIKNFHLHLELNRVYSIALNLSLSNYYFCKEKISEFSNKSIELFQKLLLDGLDLINLGLKPGPIFRKIFNELEDLQLENIIKNKEQAIAWVKENYIK